MRFYKKHRINHIPKLGMMSAEISAVVQNRWNSRGWHFTTPQRIGVSIVTSPLPILPNSYMLGSSTNGKKRRCGLKPQRQQMNTKPSFSRYVSFPQKLEALKVSYKKLPSLTSLVIKHFLFWGGGKHASIEYIIIIIYYYTEEKIPVFLFLMTKMTND